MHTKKNIKTNKQGKDIHRDLPRKNTCKTTDTQTDRYINKTFEIIKTFIFSPKNTKK